MLFAKGPKGVLVGLVTSCILYVQNIEDEVEVSYV